LNTGKHALAKSATTEEIELLKSVYTERDRSFAAFAKKWLK